jgi:hypothetical protein
VAPLRGTRRPAAALTAAAVLVAVGVAAGAAASRPVAAPLGAAAVAALISRRGALIRWALLLLVAQLAVTLAGTGPGLRPVALLAAPALVACAELAFAAGELRAVSLEPRGLLAQRLRAAGEATALAALAAAAAVGLAEAPLPRGVLLTIAGLLAAGGAVALVARERGG